MHRRSFIRNTALTFGALTLSQQKLLASFFDNPWKIMMLRNNVGVFTERGGTIGFLLGTRSIVVVDAQFPDQSKHLIEELKKRSEKPFRYLINTHHHLDHTAGNISFKGIAKNVVAHQNSLINQQNVAQKNKAEDKQLYPDITYTNRWKKRVGREKIRLYYWGAGHTNGDSLVHFERANIVHMGDLMFNRRHPFIDRSAGASIANWINILDKTPGKFERDTIYIFGHAAEGHDVTGTSADLQKFRDYLQRVLDFAQQEINRGIPKEEFIKNTSIPGVTEWTGDGIERPLTAAYEELTEKKT
ncbi:MAG: MBL fold metallo-hydrolase [Chitinophagaceae bacterium]|nr:MBL fold metallo-hydrolase [Chitinophagaceae bacterium]